MSGTKFSDLADAGAISGTDELYIAQGSDAVKKTTVSALMGAVGGYPLAAHFPTHIDATSVGITATDTDHGLVLNLKHGTGGSSADVSIRGVFKPVPSGTSWSVFGKFTCEPTGVPYFGPGIALRNSTSGKLLTWGPVWGPNKYQFNQWATPQTYSGTPFDFGSWDYDTPAKYYRIDCDGTNLNAFVSNDGDVWFQCGTTTLAAFIGTVDQIGFASNCQVASGTGQDLGMAVLEYWDSDAARGPAPGKGGSGGLDEVRWIDDRPGYPGKHHSVKLEYDTIAAGAHKTLIDMDGQGYVSTISMAIGSSDFLSYERARLRVFVDGESTPRVDCRLARFFAADFGGINFVSDYLGAKTGSGVTGYRCSFPMPFSTHIKIEIYNDVGSNIDAFWSTVDYNLNDTIKWGRFKRFNALEMGGVSGVGPAPYAVSTLIDISAKRGQLVGVYQIFNGGGGTDWAYLEGNHKFYIDGDTSPTMESSGTEDYYCNWFYFAGGVETSKFFGCTHKGSSFDVGAYRIHGLDPVPFDTGLKITWTCGDAAQGGGRSASLADYASVVWYYTDA